jgi:hypothetical protein
MAAGRRLVATFAYKARFAIPKILYFGNDVDEAKAAMNAAIDKGYWQIKVCRDFDVAFLHRWNSTPPVTVKALISS